MTMRRTRLVVWLTLAALACARSHANAQAPQQNTATGTLTVAVNPPAALYVNGALVDANVTQRDVVLPAGYHRLRVIHPDYLDFVRLIRIEPDRTSKLDVQLALQMVRLRGNV